MNIKKVKKQFKSNSQSLSDETRKKIEEQMIKNFIKDARDRGGL